MKRKAKIRTRRDSPPPDTSQTTVELSAAPATPGRSSIECVDEPKTGSIESVRQSCKENGVAGFIEPDGSEAEDAR